MTTNYEEEVERHYRWNFAIIGGVHGCWGLGSAFVSYVVILPVFLKKLGANEFAIGLMPALFMLCLSMPQLLAARLTRHLPIKKVFFTFTHYPCTLSLLLLAYLAVRPADISESAVVVAVFAWVAIYGLSISFAMPMWVNLQAKLFPTAVRGKSFGYVFLWGSVLGAIGSKGAERILDRYPYPSNFAILFAAGGIVLSACVTSFLWLREPASSEEATDEKATFMRDVFDILRTSPGFRWFLAARFVGALSLMAAAFYTVAGIEKFELPCAVAGNFGAVMLAAQVLGSLAAGRLGDRFGFKLVFLITSALGIAAATTAIVAPTPGWYYLVFVLFGARRATASIGFHNLCIEFCPTPDKTTFVALASTVLCPAYVLGPVAGGLLARHHGAHYNAVFAVAVVCAFVAMVVTAFRVPEPRRTEPA